MRNSAICVAIFVTLSGAAFAQTPAPQACTRAPHMAGQTRSPQMIAAHHAMKQACAADEAKFCANVPRGCGQEKQCLMSHASQLSASCTNAWQNMRAARHG